MKNVELFSLRCDLEFLNLEFSFLIGFKPTTLHF